MFSYLYYEYVFFFFSWGWKFDFYNKEIGVQQSKEEDQKQQNKITSFLGESKRLQKED